ncbi:MAG: hypothetical protein CSA42_05660 [Gammaproteobacteria bacterium]|nr:MAG: hypothetical protein CSA42_05660 [Gammaproteobacteria bacterium]
MLKPLPLPPLEQTLDKFLDAIQPVFDSKLNETAKEITYSFKEKQGANRQKQLSEYAKIQAKQGKSWLSDFWLEGYLVGRQPKALSSNAGCQINYTTDKTDFPRAAQLIHCLVITHRNFIDGRIGPTTDNRNNPLSMDGWKTLTGAMRHPQEKCDSYYYSNKGINNRHISIFWQGHHYLLPVTDAQGNVFSVQAIEKALLTLPQTDKPVILPFTAISALSSTDASQQLNDLCQNTHNATVYNTLKDSLFCFSLYHSGDDELSQLVTQSFFPAHAWQYKPFTYQMDLDSNYLSLHIEHTGLDGGTINDILSYAFEQSVVEETTETTELKLLDWQMTPIQSQTIHNLLKPIEDSAKKIAIRQFTVDYSPIKTKVSHDALFQFSLIYAQLKVFNELKNTYEAVDTRNFLAGRTECLRSNTMQAKNLAEKLLLNTATTDDLTNALTAHKSWVIACKTGQGIDRHLYALKEICTEYDDVSQKFFELVDKFAGKDFLSTSTVGGQYPIHRVLFFPTSQGGFGVNYSINNPYYEFCLTADAISANKLDEMQQAIQEGAKKLIDMVALM